MKRAIVAAMLVLLSQAGPSQTTLSSVPQWYKPCSNAEGDTQSQWVKVASSDRNLLGRKLVRSLKKVTQQLNVSMEQFKNQLFNDSYGQIQVAVDSLQYVPKWVPGMGNVLVLFSERPTRLQVLRYLPKFHKELQIFAVALEAIIQKKPQREIVEETNTLLIQLLCVVEQALVAQQIGVPAPRVERSLMAEEDRIPTTVRRRLIRDWWILTKYRDYLHYWRELLFKMEKQRKMRKLDKGSNATETRKARP